MKLFFDEVGCDWGFALEVCTSGPITEGARQGINDMLIALNGALLAANCGGKVTIIEE